MMEDEEIWLMAYLAHAKTCTPGTAAADADNALRYFKERFRKIDLIEDNSGNTVSFNDTPEQSPLMGDVEHIKIGQF